MYPVTTDFLNKIKQIDGVKYNISIEIQHSKGVLKLSHEDTEFNPLTYSESSQSGEEFTIGSTVASDISFTIFNKLEYDTIQFMGATVICNVGVLVKEGIDAHFLQPSQPSKMIGFEEKWEWVPLGRFNIDIVNKLRNTIELKAIDSMINLDKPYSLSKLSYPATLYQIYVNACNVCDVLPGTVSFPNMNYVVQNRPDGDLTFRDVIGYVAELSGTFAKCNRSGAIELKWYTPSGLTIEPMNRFDFKVSDDVVQIKGIMATVGDTTYLAGTEDYAIDLTENPLLQGGHETVLPNIFNNVKNTVFTPYTSGWQGNPAIQAGDMITQIDRDGKVYNTLITKSIYKYRGKSTLEAKGLPEISKGYKGDVHRKIAQIKKKIDVEVGDKLTTLEQAQLNATELMANMLGGYKTTIKYESDPDYARFGMGEFIHDSPRLSDSTKIWKWGPGGFGHSSDGGLTWPTAITADGSIVAMLVAANIVTANMVQTGVLQSEDGSTWINLDNGAFNFKNALQWINNQLLISQGVVTIDKDKIRINHVGTNQYSEMTALGMFRKWQYGEARYLNDIYAISSLSANNDFDYPNLVRISLPTSFRGRGNDVEIILSPIGWYNYLATLRRTEGAGTLFAVTETVEVVLEVHDSNFDATNPYVDVYAYIKEEQIRSSTLLEKTTYRDIGFSLIVVGK